MSKHSCILRNERGESLVTIALAMMILMVAGMVAGPTVMRAVQSQKNNLMAPSFCRDISQNILAQVRSNGMQTKVYRGPASSNSVSFRSNRWRNNAASMDNINPGGVVNEHGVGAALDATRWPNLAPMRWDTGRRYFVPHGPRLLYSSMNLLQSVNNAFGNRACTQPEGISIDAASGLEPLLPQSTLDMYAEAGYFVSASIKTQPFRVTDENLLPCNGNLQLRPFSSMEPPLSDTQGLTADLDNLLSRNVVNTRPNLANTYQADQGIRAEVFVTIDHIDPEERNGEHRRVCSSTEKFQYDRVISNLPVPTFSASGDMVIRVESPTTTPRRRLTGVFMACAFEYQIVSVAGLSVSFGPTVGNFNEWIPCEDVRICGGGAPEIRETEFSIEYDFNRSAPSSCSLSLRATTFDALGNALTSPPYVRCWGGSCGPDIDPNTGDPVTSAPSDDSSVQGYQVAGVTFDNPAAAQQASALTGAPVQPVDISATAQASINSAQMLSHTSAVTSVTASTASVNAQVGGLSADGTAGSVSAAQSAVSNASANVSNAQAAVSAANSMSSSMGAVKDAAVAEAEEALAEAEAALAAAEAALEAAEEAKEEADAANDDDGDP